MAQPFGEICGDGRFGVGGIFKQNSQFLCFRNVIFSHATIHL